MARKKVGDDRPVEMLTVTVMDDQGRPRTQIKLGDRISADVVADKYRSGGAEVTITPTQD